MKFVDVLFCEWEWKVIGVIEVVFVGDKEEKDNDGVDIVMVEDGLGNENDGKEDDNENKVLEFYRSVI